MPCPGDPPWMPAYLPQPRLLLPEVTKVRGRSINLFRIRDLVSHAVGTVVSSTSHFTLLQTVIRLDHAVVAHAVSNKPRLLPGPDPRYSEHLSSHSSILSVILPSFSGKKRPCRQGQVGSGLLDCMAFCQLWRHRGSTLPSLLYLWWRA